MITLTGRFERRGVTLDERSAAVCVSPNWQTLDDDDDLLSAVQSAWPTVAAARYPT